MAHTKIEWTEMAWNPSTGCTKVSSGCRYCYAEVMAKRLKAMGVKKYQNGFNISLHIQEVFNVMNDNNHHVFQILTKRAEVLMARSKQLKWTSNIWMGVTIEESSTLNRMDFLRKIPASIKFLSFEPLLGPIGEINLKGINWVIVGGESGMHSRPVKKEWVLEIMEQCKNQNIPFFFKQWGGRFKKRAGYLLEGENYREMPLNLVS